MFKFRAFRLGNSILLGLIALLTGAVFFQSSGAQGDSFGTDCRQSWENISGFCFEDTVKQDTHGTNCATSPSFLCCTYEVSKVVCPPDTIEGYAYDLTKGGESGKTCYAGKCY